METLVQKAKTGDVQAFREIFESFSSKLFLYLLSRTSAREDALDLAQEIFIDLWKELGTFEFRSDEAFSGFVFSIAKRKLYHYYQSKRETIPLDENLPGASYEMETNDYRYLTKHINMLAEKYQELLKLRYWSGLTFAEIASVLNIREGRAKVWHHRAIKKLQTLMEQHGEAI